MSKALLPLLASFIIAIIMASGCIIPEVEAVNEAKKHIAVIDFLANHPRAEVSTASWTEAETNQRLSEIILKCGPQIMPTDYRYVKFVDGDSYLEAWVYQKSMGVACVYRNDYQCVRDLDCEDGDLCTKDVCDGIPKACSRQPIGDCLGGDGCCPTGCSYSIDFDCQPDECTYHEDCDDDSAATVDYCEGQPKRCRYELVSECLGGDDYCPPGCNYVSDSDCAIGECEKDEDCDDHDFSTKDKCTGSPSLCTHEKIMECISNDYHCPVGCDYSTDSDCSAEVGDKERITIECNDIQTLLDSDLMEKNGQMEASFSEKVSYYNNEALKYYKNKSYVYNTLETKFSSMTERIIVNGKATFDNDTRRSNLQLHKNGLSYQLELTNGIPAIDSSSDPVPFFADDVDKIVIPFFGKDSLVTEISQEQGNEYIELLSDYVELTVSAGALARNLEGKDGELHRIKVARCDEGSAIFSLYLGDDLITSQTASSGDYLFQDELKKSVRLNYLNRDNVVGRCDYRYAKGSFVETLIDGEEFPLGSDSGWIVDLVFEDDELHEINIELEYGEGSLIPSGKELLILPGEESVSFEFCSMRFVGLSK